ncbi:TldD/PmbA family protein [Stakelama saccharophila]|uniref:TldD/PmbA family protein n=1 Tax=Stakelama saccharophila TaxID=3075605 RepID=A0ABZ0B9A4_9SPHN|nr:TldD/PmbA family protein [Stakelama sp. W311]WNO53953.1 TldD/PmbA family protein [Stakelama sp. W311]
MLTPETSRSLAQSAVDRAIARGADAADAHYITDRSVAVSVRLGALEDVERSEGDTLTLRVFIGRRSASVSSSDLSDGALAALADRAIAMAREASEDRWSGLAPAERLLHGSPPHLDIDDGADVSPEALKQRALVAEEAARSIAGVTNSEGGSASASRTITALATSHGFAGSYATSSHAISASVVAGRAGALQRDHAHHTTRHLRLLDAPEDIGRLAGERAVARLSPARIGSATMPVVFDPRVGGSLMGAFVGAISGTRIAARTSFLRDALGQRVFARGVTIRDDPHRPRGLRSRPYDGEGVGGSPVSIVEDGLLETWLLDSASARQLEMEPTGHAAPGGGVSVSNLYMEAGNVPVESLVADIERGVWVTELIGQGVNPVTGDYSRGAAGFLIEKGEVTTPVAEITVAGNLKDMFARAMPANDLEFRYGVNVPTLRIDGMTVAGD